MSFWTSAGSDSSREAASWVAPDENVYALAVRAVAMRSVFFIVLLSGCRPKQPCRLEPFFRNAISRDKSVHEPIVRRPAHPRQLVGVLVIGRVAAKPQAQLASAPECSVILSLSLGGVGKLISAPRPKVTAAERQIQLAHPPVQMRAHEPPSQPTEMWAGGCETDFVVNLELLARPVVGHRISQAQPTVPRVTHERLELHIYIVAVQLMQPHRQTLPDMAASMSSSVGFGVSFSSAAADMIWPDWQPHCTTSSSSHVFCKAAPCGVWPIASIVVIALSPMLSTVVMQVRVAAPSTCMVQAPHSAWPQPNLVPVMPSTSRSTHSSGVSPSTSTSWGVPLIFNMKAMAASRWRG